MSSQIDYYTTSASPFAYMGHKAIIAVAEKHGVKINLKPMNLLGVWEISGATMPADRPPVRQRYRLLELPRIADYRGLKIIPQPSNFPTNPALADHCLCVLIAEGKDATNLAFKIGEALWTHDRQIADEAVLAELLESEGHDAKSVLSRANEDDIAELRAKHTQEAIDADVVGAPGYVFGGEVFWGQDRIEHLDAMIASGRSAYT